MRKFWKSASTALRPFPSTLFVSVFGQSTFEVLNLAMSRLSSPQTLIAPNGESIALQMGLFINNEFLGSTKDDGITSIDPA